MAWLQNIGKSAAFTADGGVGGGFSVKEVKRRNHETNILKWDAPE